ncbi:MAG: hypothetical protein H7Y37_01190 [Anaerolineae bacterium]|nr:hypothetical protein [Gloeobacterales cyanobacterium ES-bin-313]
MSPVEALGYQADEAGTLDSDVERLEYLRVHHETAYAFTFADPKPSPEMPVDIDLNALRDGCPV